MWHVFAAAGTSLSVLLGFAAIVGSFLNSYTADKYDGLMAQRLHGAHTFARPGRAGVHHFPRRRLKSAPVHPGCCRCGDECGGGSRVFDFQARAHTMKIRGALDSGLSRADLNHLGLGTFSL